MQQRTLGERFKFLARRAQLALGAEPVPAEMLGALPDPVDSRDFVRERIVGSAPIVSLAPYGPEAWNQGATNSCTGHAGAAFLFNLYGRALGKNRGWTPSPFWLYYMARQKSGMEGADNGAYLRDLMKVMHEDGAAPIEAHATRSPRTPPSEQSLRFAKSMTVRDYQRILAIATAPKVMMTTIGDEKLPVIAGIRLFESINSSTAKFSGRISIPAAGEREIGGHAVLIDGYDARREVFYGLNSWGTQWGLGGRFEIPFEYFSRPDLTQDLWTASYIYW